MFEKIKRPIIFSLILLSGYSIAKIENKILPPIETLQLKAQSTQKSVKNPHLVKLKKIEGDQLWIEIFGSVKIAGLKENQITTEGVHTLNLGQIPTENDLKLRSFPYVGNAKTRKFYPSYTYPARGTAVKQRRFFQNQQEAIDAGFIASKLVK